MFVQVERQRIVVGTFSTAVCAVSFPLCFHFQCRVVLKQIITCIIHSLVSESQYITPSTYLFLGPRQRARTQPKAAVLCCLALHKRGGRCVQHLFLFRLAAYTAVFRVLLSSSFLRYSSSAFRSTLAHRSLSCS